MSKNVLLINPANISYILPEDKIMRFGLRYIASVLIKTGYNVQCLDLQVEDESVLENKIKENDVIGISALTPNIQKTLRITKIIYNKLVFLGSFHSSMLFQESVNSSFVDIVCRGEYYILKMKLYNIIEIR